MMCNLQAILIQEVYVCLTCLLAEEGTESRAVHAYVLGYFVDSYLSGIVATGINRNLLQARFCLCKLHITNSLCVAV